MSFLAFLVCFWSKFLVVSLKISQSHRGFREEITLELSKISFSYLVLSVPSLEECESEGFET